jgi:hypothetical protein
MAARLVALVRLTTSAIRILTQAFFTNFGKSQVLASIRRARVERPFGLRTADRQPSVRSMQDEGFLTSL